LRLENKEKIRYILKFYYKRGKNVRLRLLKKFVKFVKNLWTWFSISITYGTKLVQAFSVWKFWWQRYPLTNHWKSSWNYAKS